VSPPRPPQLEPERPNDPLEALIEEARRRARRRRRRIGMAMAAMLALSLGAAYAFASHVEPSRSLDHAGAVRASASTGSAKNGELTIMEAAPNANGGGLEGWYGLSSIAGDGRLRPVVRCPNGVEWCGWVLSIDWSPTGRRLALAVTSFGSANPYNGIHVVDLATGQDKQLRACRPPECDWFDLDWSPDGRTLAYVALGGIYLVRPDASGGQAAPRRLVTGRQPTWSADGRSIAFVRTGRDGRRSIRIIGVDGSHPRMLVASAAGPAWSPNGRSIAYRHGCKILMTTPTGVDVTPRLLRRCPVPSDHRVGPPVWSPDGTMIAFSGVAGTYVMDADGSGLHRVSPKAIGCSCGQQARPAWRPIP